MDLFITSHGKNPVFIELHHRARFTQSMLELKGIAKNRGIPGIRLGN
ncbi:hypothetical protein J2T22_004041 [Pseudarthrobacter defluvii]|uniref:Uncharacterized protein n=1 Tax=Pseudarthrobacter defluvii TaxID=410837 RepID=A0ABT9UMF6_9MICC|nr:hypothetical protein [Pseudarthrobacter defluvii]